jgi:hypothetical protein
MLVQDSRERADIRIVIEYDPVPGRAGELERLPEILS